MTITPKMQAVLAKMLSSKTVEYWNIELDEDGFAGMLEFDKVVTINGEKVNFSMTASFTVSEAKDD